MIRVMHKSGTGPFVSKVMHKSGSGTGWALNFIAPKFLVGVAPIG
ncbi:hypothetical protein GMMP1_1260005 [Candidatus Magnetomoraceae bacterium gMMP-1]